MNNAKLYFLLKIIKQKQNLNGLLRAGLSYKNIAEFTELAGNQNLLEISEKGIVLTIAGEKKYEELKVLNKKTNKQVGIST